MACLWSPPWEGEVSPGSWLALPGRLAAPTAWLGLIQRSVGCMP